MIRVGTDKSWIRDITQHQHRKYYNRKADKWKMYEAVRRRSMINSEKGKVHKEKKQRN